MRQDLKKDELASRIRGAIGMSGMTRDQVADKVGISRPTLYTYTSGRRSPTVRVFKKLCEVCGVSPKEVL